MQNWKTDKLKRLAVALRSLRTDEEVLAFLRDVATLKELNELSSRWEAVRQLERGVAYRDIASSTGMSTTTVTRIAHWLYHGEGGYRAALKRLKK